MDQLTPDKVDIIARTRIELDGDRWDIVPKNLDGASKEIWNFYLKNVNSAVNDWSNYLNVVLNALKFIAELIAQGKILGQ